MPRDPELREKPAPDQARSIARQTGSKAGGRHDHPRYRLPCLPSAEPRIDSRCVSGRAPAWHSNGSVLAHSADPTAGCRVHPIQHWLGSSALCVAFGPRSGRRWPRADEPGRPPRSRSQRDPSGAPQRLTPSRVRNAGKRELAHDCGLRTGRVTSSLSLMAVLIARNSHLSVGTAQYATVTSPLCDVPERGDRPPRSNGVRTRVRHHRDV
jgi:hypothetical protein